MEDLIKAFEIQGQYCAEAGVPTYAFLCQKIGEDLKAGGPATALLHPWPGSVKDDNVALRLLGGIHRLALDGHAPDLSRHFQTTGGDGNVEATWPGVARLLTEHADDLRVYLKDPPQTNEVMRSAALLPGFLTIARETGLSLRILELGASGGLNQVWDQHFYDFEAFTWGNPDAALKLTSRWTGPRPDLPSVVHVMDRAACDLNPIDLSSKDGRQRLKSYVWADQPERMHRLTTAIDVAQDLNVTVDQSDAGDWLAVKLANPVPGTATVVYHSIAWQYFPKAVQASIRKTFERAWASAPSDAPIFWLTMEIAERKAGALPKLILTGNPELALNDRTLAEVHFHGGFVNWAA